MKESRVRAVFSINYYDPFGDEYAADWNYDIPQKWSMSYRDRAATWKSWEPKIMSLKVD
jgi:hypothetical protein